MQPQPLDPELSALQSALMQWRKHRAGRQIPSEIAARAVALLERYRPMVIMRALKIDSRTLQRWRRLHSRPILATEAEVASAPTPAFVELPTSAVNHEPAPQPRPPEHERLPLTLTRHEGDAPRVSLAGTLTLGQWRQALTLLNEVSG